MESNNIKQPAKVLINCHTSSHAHLILQELYKENLGWKETLDKQFNDVNFLWHTVPDDEIFNILINKNTILNRYPNIKDISRKDNFENMMSIAANIDQKAYDFVPRTFVLPNDEKKFLEYQENNKNAVFIAKPSNGSEGNNIKLFQDLRQIQEFNSPETVIQRYISNPLLLNGYKFDLRIYVVVTGIKDGQIHAFLADEGLARFCTEKYQKPNKDNFKKIYMHLTNYSINILSKTWVDESEVENIFEPNLCSKRTLTALWKQIEQEFQDQPGIIDQIKESIKYTCSGTISMLQNMILLMTNRSNPNSQKQDQKMKGKVFQIFVFDILIDENLKAWLLEINDHPSLNVVACKQSMGCNHKGCPVAAVDMHVKKQVLNDSIKLCLKQRRTSIQNIDDNFRNLQRIFPNDDPVFNQVNLQVSQLRKLFLSLSNGKLELSSADFQNKLYKNSTLKNKFGFQRIELHLIFQYGSKNQRTVDIFGFYNVLMRLQEKCNEITKDEDEQNIENLYKILEILE